MVACRKTRPGVTVERNLLICLMDEENSEQNPQPRGNPAPIAHTNDDPRRYCSRKPRIRKRFDTS